MGDMGEFWRDVNAAKKESKNKRWAENEKKLCDLAWKNKLTVVIANHGTGHAIVNGKIDFYLSTGTWLVRGKQRRGHGVKQLLHFLETEKSDSQEVGKQLCR